MLLVTISSATAAVARAWHDARSRAPCGCKWDVCDACDRRVPRGDLHHFDEMASGECDVCSECAGSAPAGATCGSCQPCAHDEVDLRDALRFALLSEADTEHRGMGVMPVVELDRLVVRQELDDIR